MDPRPPLYSFDFPVPGYSSEPRVDEERLEYQQARWQENETRPTGIFLRQNNGITIILNHQEDKATSPIFRQRSTIEGTLTIDVPESVSDVTLKLSGSIEVVSPTVGWMSIEVLNQKYTLFKSDSDDSRTTSSHCPSSLQFSCPLPRTFQHDGKEHPLPPSYYILLPGETHSQAYYVKCTYTFVAITSKTRSRHTAFLGKNKKANSFIFEYLPRWRPPRPVIDRSLLSTIRVCPGEWRRFSYQVVPKSDKHQLGSLTCLFFLPSVGVFGITDSIRFHVQIVGPRASLSQLQPGSSSSSKRQTSIRVHLMRQVVIEKNGHKNAVHLFLGEAKLSPLPPVEGTLSLEGLEQRQDDNSNWEGELRCESEARPTFSAGAVTVMDFVVLELSKGYASLFHPFKHGHPVRLVSDSWKDAGR